MKTECPLGCPCENYDCDLPEKKAILVLYSRTPDQPSVLIQPNGRHKILKFQQVTAKIKIFRFLRWYYQGL